MRKFHQGALAALVLTLIGVLALAAPAWSQLTVKEPPSLKEPATLKGRLAKAVDVPEEKVEKFLKALGPAVAAQLAKGEKVEFPGLGTFRVVRVPEHRDLVNGRPAMIPANNYVEFIPTAGLVDASNAPGAVPQDTVPIWRFDPLPGDSAPSNRLPATRVPSSKTR
jgi:nucleoid DNA-binding protein